MSVDPYLGYAPVIRLEEEARARFVMRTSLHLLGAFAAFVLLEVVFFTTGLAAPMAKFMLSFSWALFLGLFIVVSWIASRFAHSAESLSVQYMGLAAYVIAEAVIFVPLLYIAETVAPGVLQSSVTLTLAGFGGLTVIAFVTRADFSFLRGLLYWGGVVALILILRGLLFQWRLGT